MNMFDGMRDLVLPDLEGQLHRKLTLEEEYIASMAIFSASKHLLVIPTVT